MGLRPERDSVSKHRQTCAFLSQNIGLVSYISGVREVGSMARITSNVQDLTILVVK